MNKEQRNAAWRAEYESGMNLPQIAKRHGLHQETVRQGILKSGGKPRRRARKYFHNSVRERQLKCAFGVVYDDMVHMRRKQRGLCLWCKAVLPVDVLKCVVDHFGGRDTFGDRLTVRGLCCSSGHCNRIAGMIDRGQFVENGLLVRFIQHVKRIIKTNKGVLREEKQR